MGASTAGCSDAIPLSRLLWASSYHCFHKPSAEKEALDSLVFQSVQQRRVGHLPSRPAS